MRKAERLNRPEHSGMFVELESGAKTILLASLKGEIPLFWLFYLVARIDDWQEVESELSCRVTAEGMSEVERYLKEHHVSLSNLKAFYEFKCWLSPHLTNNCIIKVKGVRELLVNALDEDSTESSQRMMTRLFNAMDFSSYLKKKPYTRMISQYGKVVWECQSQLYRKIETDYYLAKLPEQIKQSKSVRFDVLFNLLVPSFLLVCCGMIVVNLIIRRGGNLAVGGITSIKAMVGILFFAVIAVGAGIAFVINLKEVGTKTKDIKRNKQLRRFYEEQKVKG